VPEPTYTSKAPTVVFHRIAPTDGLAGLCAVVPVGTVNAPVVLEASIMPESAVKAKVPVVSGLILKAVPLVVPVLIIDAIMYLK
jgi:hypothetical protein